VIEFDKESWAESMRDVLREANAAVREAREGGRGRCRPSRSRPSSIAIGD
jgi:hypothetical protein